MSKTHLEYSFQKNKGILYKTVNEMSVKAFQMGITIDLLEREAELSFVVAYSKWAEKDRTGSFPPFLKACVANRLRNYLRNEYRRTNRVSFLDNKLSAVLPWEGPTPSASISYREIYQELSEDAKEVISTLFHAPEELLEDLRNTESIKLVRGALKRWFKKEGWERKRINDTFLEIGRAFG